MGYIWFDYMSVCWQTCMICMTFKIFLSCNHGSVLTFPDSSQLLRDLLAKVSFALKILTCHDLSWLILIWHEFLFLFLISCGLCLPVKPLSNLTQLYTPISIPIFEYFSTVCNSSKTSYKKKVTLEELLKCEWPC